MTYKYNKKKTFREELSNFLGWLDVLTSEGLHEAEREILEKIEEIKGKEGFY